MQVLRVVGDSDTDTTVFVERLAARLSDRGRVGTISRIDSEPGLDTEGKDTARHRAAGASETYGVMTDGSWFATGTDGTISNALDWLAVECEYAIIDDVARGIDGVGWSLPTVALGDVDVETAVATAPGADAVDLDAVLDALEAADAYETLESLVAQVKRASDADRSGAIATFTGRVRERDGPDDPPTEFLEFERYDDVARERMASLRDELLERDGVHDVRLHHKTGRVEAGEDIVFVVILAGHREEAFVAVEDGIDRLKAEVPLFKKEVTVEEEFWAHED